MSTLWTPDGERPIRREAPPGPSGQPSPGGRGGPGGGAGAGAGGGAGGGRAGDGPGDPEAAPLDDDSEAMAAELDELRDQLARTPAAQVVANHAFGLFELAALHLALKPPQLEEARLAVDALGALVEGMAGRLSDFEPQLLDGLAQLRIAYVHIKSANSPS
jgi:hypothetical protein